jgi:hypothetical protein
MTVETSWIVNGRPTRVVAGEVGSRDDEDALIQRNGYVRLTAAPGVTEVKWAVFAPNWASIFYAMNWLPRFPPPYRLRYFIVGWCEEHHDDVGSACERLDEILAKSDIHITKRTFVKDMDPGKTAMPELLRDALLDHTVGPEFAVDCVFDSSVGRFCVERVGSRSAIAQIWGLSPSSYPCQSGHTYDQMVSMAYAKVLRTGLPHYDHVMASMLTPDKVPLWVPYQRVVLPHRFPDGRKGVSVISQLTKVDIKLL